jgi:tetratricopeptide (TPR) repeat protein
VRTQTLEALAHIRRAIALLEATEDTFFLARAYMLAAGVEVTEGQIAAAKEHLERAQRLVGPAPEALDAGMLRIVEARIALADDEPEGAAELARGAIAALGDYHGGEQGDAVWALGQALALQGDLVGAGDAYRRAVDLLALHGRQGEAAAAAREWAEALEREGRGDAAEALRAEAERLAATVGRRHPNPRAAVRS